MSRILDRKKFKYTPAASTDLRKTFARVRREIEAKKNAEQMRLVSIMKMRRVA